MKLFATTAVAALLVTAAPASAFDWNGFYAGLGAGYSSGHADVAYVDPTLSPFDFTMAPAGGLAGLVVGANVDTGGGLVLGVEADLYLANITDTVDDGLGIFVSSSPQTVTATTDVAGSLRGRIGFNGGDFLPYVTGGLVVAHSVTTATHGSLRDEGILFGGAIGAGVEVAVTDTVTIKGEYLYTAFAPHTWYEGEDYENTASSSSSTIRGGVNFHF